MLGKEAMTKAMTDIIAPGGVIITEEAAADANLKKMLGEFGVNPDDAFELGNGIMQGAVAAQESPEQAVVGSFVMGLAVGAYLMRMPEADHA